MTGRRASYALFSMLSLAAIPLLTGTVLAGEMTLERDKHVDRGVTVLLDGELFTEYLIDHGPRPILWPIIAPGGKELTRQYPMKFAIDERRDHPHHRSLWFTHGNVNGIDFWAETDPHGSIKHREWVRVEAKGDTAVIVTRNDWLGPDGKKVCEDERTVTCRDRGKTRTIDVELTLTASDGPVTFGDTKEGSFAVRVDRQMKVDAEAGGRIVNSEGQTDKDAWGKRARWVDYHGPVDGEVLGIAILNHPTSLRYPTHWHVRTYGLFAANPFGLHDFEGGEDGSLELKQGESFTLRYRVVLHRGDEKEGQIEQAFQEYASEQFEEN